MAGGDLMEALTQYQRAAELRPHDDDPWRCLAALHRQARRLDASNDAAIKVIEIVARKLEASLEDVVLFSRLAEAYARVGGREETHAILRRVLEIDPLDGLVFYNCACAHALLRETAPALLFLRRAFDSGFRAVVRSAQADGTFDAIVGDPAFVSLIAELES